MAEEIKDAVVAPAVVVDFTDMSLSEIFEPIENKRYKDYLYLRIRGMSMRAAGEVVNEYFATVYQWRNKDPYLRALDDYIGKNRERFKDSALTWFLRDAEDKATIVIKNLIGKGANWEELTEEDKRDVKWAIGMVWGKRKKDDIGGYDELILTQTKRRKLG